MRVSRFVPRIRARTKFKPRLVSRPSRRDIVSIVGAQQTLLMVTVFYAVVSLFLGGDIL